MRFVPFSLVLLAHIAVAADSQAQPAKAPNVDLHGDEFPEKVLVRLGTTRFQPFGHVSAAALLPDGRVAFGDRLHERGDFVPANRFHGHVIGQDRSHVRVCERPRP